MFVIAELGANLPGSTSSSTIPPVRRPEPTSPFNTALVHIDWESATETSHARQALRVHDDSFAGGEQGR